MSLSLSGLLRAALPTLFAGVFISHLAAASLTEVRVHPAAINLEGSGDRQSFIVQAVYDDGVTRDVTAEASVSIADKHIAGAAAAVLLPVADGRTELRVKFKGHSVVVPVSVARAKIADPIGFNKDVMPVLTKAGCNSGGCHGASRGKDGFRLSLFGYDPEGDYFRLTRESIGRRVNLALPEESTLLEKAIGRVPHTGGERFKVDSFLYRTLLAWIEAGAPRDAAGSPTVVRIEVHPLQSVIEGIGDGQQLNVRAVYSDGSDRDVTALAAYFSGNDGVVKVSESGRVSVLARGETFVTVRFEGLAVGAQVLAIPRDLRFRWPKVEERNFIDTLVHAKLRRLRVAPADICDDATFLRRASIDLAGALPSPERVRSFLADRSPGKRAALVDELLSSPAFNDVWVMKWAELLQIRSADQQVQMSFKSAAQYFEWLENQITEGTPADVMVRSLLTATGPSFEEPAANFYKVERDPLKLSENVAQAFLGVRLQCAQCHNHPFDRWSMNDYYGFAAFFAQVGRKPGEDPREAVIFNGASGVVRHPVGGKDVPPRFLGGAQPAIPKGADRRRVLSDWLTAPENPYFARNLANWIWAHFMGIGIVEPVDDVRVSNPPSNADLLDALAARLVEYRYDFRRLIRDICNSRTYQLAAGSERGAADRDFAAGRVRRIRAEVLLDAIGGITGSTDKFRGQAPGTRAVEIADGRTSNYFLTTFGRATRETPCSCEVKMEPNLSQALHLLNGDTVNAKINSGGLVARWLKEGRPRAAIIDELYLRALGRPPSGMELERLEVFFGDGRREGDALNDLFWSLLNAKEFVFNH